jgi:hypothetical protein
MQISKVETTRQGMSKRANGKAPVLYHNLRSNADAHEFQRALQALGAVYARVAALLDEALERSDTDLSQLSALGANYAWISERRLLVKAFLDSEPAILAYAHCDCRCPGQIRSLAETAIELASQAETLPSALGMLNYIDLELGWAQGEGRLAVG